MPRAQRTESLEARRSVLDGIFQYHMIATAFPIKTYSLRRWKQDATTVRCGAPSCGCMPVHTYAMWTLGSKHFRSASLCALFSTSDTSSTHQYACTSFPPHSASSHVQEICSREPAYASSSCVSTDITPPITSPPCHASTNHHHRIHCSSTAPTPTP